MSIAGPAMVNASAIFTRKLMRSACLWRQRRMGICQRNTRKTNNVEANKKAASGKTRNEMQNLCESE